METLVYLIPAGVIAAIGAAYASGAFSMTNYSEDTSFIDPAFSTTGGRRKKHRKTKRRGTK